MEQWETSWKDHYNTLGVCMSAEPEVIKGAYNAMARKYHPDVNPAGAARMKEVNEAYEVLSDPRRKAQYDSCYRQKQGPSNAGSSGNAQNSGSSYQDGSTYRQQQNSGHSHDQSHRESPSPPGNNGPGVLPWPSLTWQRVALFCSIPLGIGLILTHLSLWLSIAGLFILIVACFAVVKTRGLNRIGKGWTATTVSAGFCITSSLCVLGAVVLVIAVVFIIIVAIIAGVKALTVS